MKRLFRSIVDQRIRDGLWAWRTRGDGSVLSAVLRDLLGRRHAAGSDQDHLQATMTWLCAAQDALAEGGVSAFYDVRLGAWGPPYPETTGYIIPTFFDFAGYSGDDAYRTRAVRMANWLLTLQLPGGAFPIGPLWPDWERAPLVFDTGQIIHGLVRVYEETQREDFLDSARRAGRWLVEIQDEDGAWRKFTSLGIVHTYNVRTAWSLLRLHQVDPEPQIRQAAVKNLAWAVQDQDEDGWFRNAHFRPEEPPLTHTIAYTIEGLLESGVLLQDQQVIGAARRAADALCQRQDQDGFLRARYGQGWSSTLDWSCLTGDAQMAILWQRLYQITGDQGYLHAALMANTFVKQAQNRASRLPGVYGSLAGSQPIFGDYEPYRNLNWAAKFFADSLLLSIDLTQ
jgi:Squalene-hopene cyclase C-terminal domain